jgi:hypothetical protein
VSLYKNPLADDKLVYTKVVLGVCKNLESLDHNDVEEMKGKLELQNLSNIDVDKEIGQSNPSEKPLSIIKNYFDDKEVLT